MRDIIIALALLVTLSGLLCAVVAAAALDLREMLEDKS